MIKVTNFHFQKQTWALTHTYAHTQKHTHTHPYILHLLIMYTHTHTHNPTLTHTHTHSFSHNLHITHTHTHTHTHTMAGLTCAGRCVFREHTVELRQGGIPVLGWQGLFGRGGAEGGVLLTQTPKIHAEGLREHPEWSSASVGRECTTWTNHRGRASDTEHTDWILLTCIVVWQGRPRHDFLTRVYRAKQHIANLKGTTCELNGQSNYTPPIRASMNRLVWIVYRSVRATFSCFPFTAPEVYMNTHVFWEYIDRQLEDSKEQFAEFDKKCIGLESTFHIL